MAIGIIVITLLIMSTGRAPLYLTAVLGGVAALLADGVPLSGESVDTVSTILKGRSIRCPWWICWGCCSLSAS